MAASEPNTVAVLGASADRSKYGNKAVRAYLRAGWRVFPVNPRGGQIERLPVFRSLREIPDPIQRVTTYLPPAVGIHVLGDIAAIKPAEFFVNPGAESDELLAAAARLGLEPILACSIIEIGHTPDEYQA
ncbi:MAG: CoA-binding protein [Phycisphaerae bacterium]